MSKYSNFINKYGKIIFPCYFVLYFLVLLMPYIDLSAYPMNNNYFPAYRIFSTAKIYTEAISNNIIPSTYVYSFLIISSILLALSFAVIAVFLIIFFAKKKTIKLLLILPIVLTLISIILALFEYKVAPSAGFYFMFILLIPSILYCLPHKQKAQPPKDEQINS